MAGILLALALVVCCVLAVGAFAALHDPWGRIKRRAARTEKQGAS